MNKYTFLFLIALFSVLKGLYAESHGTTKLEALIELLPSQLTEGNLEAIKPGSPIVLSLKIKNKGTKPNEKGYFFIQSSHLNPNTKQNVKPYLSEKVSLPPIAPGKEATIIFKTTETSPSLSDFMKADYENTPYQAVIVIDSKEYILGKVNLAVSAYYFSGPAEQKETEVPAID